MIHFVSTGPQNLHRLHSTQSIQDQDASDTIMSEMLDAARGGGDVSPQGASNCVDDYESMNAEYEMTAKPRGKVSQTARGAGDIFP